MISVSDRGLSSVIKIPFYNSDKSIYLHKSLLIISNFMYTDLYIIIFRSLFTIHTSLNILTILDSLLSIYISIGILIIVCESLLPYVPFSTSTSMFKFIYVCTFTSFNPYPSSVLSLVLRVLIVLCN